MAQKTDYRYALIAGICITALIGVSFLPPISQDTDYHSFADRRMWLGIPNFFNVVSNIPFILIGAFGIGALRAIDRGQLVEAVLPAYFYFFIGVAGVGFGSIYYHLDPGNVTLIWDRLPMTLAFMAFVTIIIAEYLSERLAVWLMYPLLAAGFISVGYWYWTELSGVGDLRWYGLVQFLPLTLLPVVLGLFPPRFSGGGRYGLFFGLYAAAKVFELTDVGVYRMLSGLSGHTIKHLLAAAGCYVFLRQLIERRRL
ncbi:MAG: ceramidase domain-containing protein [Methylomicrobium sp.]